MSYSPEPGRDPRPAPWASPSTTDTNDTQRFEDTSPADSTRADQPVADHAVDHVTDHVVDHDADHAVDHGSDRAVDQPADVTPGHQDRWAADRPQQDPWAADRSQPDHTQPVPASAGSYPYAYGGGQTQPQPAGP